jgi:hypothetical protein
VAVVARVVVAPEVAAAGEPRVVVAAEPRVAGAAVVEGVARLTNLASS